MSGINSLVLSVPRLEICVPERAAFEVALRHLAGHPAITVRQCHLWESSARAIILTGTSFGQVQPECFPHSGAPELAPELSSTDLSLPHCVIPSLQHAPDDLETSSSVQDLSMLIKKRIVETHSGELPVGSGVVLRVDPRRHTVYHHADWVVFTPTTRVQGLPLSAHTINAYLALRGALLAYMHQVTSPYHDAMACPLLPSSSTKMACEQMRVAYDTLAYLTLIGQNGTELQQQHQRLMSELLE